MSETFCVLPWMHLATHPNGGASLCCRSNHTNAISWAKKAGSSDLMLLDNDQISDVINSETFVRVREQMLNLQRPVECEGCWQDEDAGLESKRQYENKRWKHVIPLLEQKAEITKPKYKYLELRLGNTCNSACITCNSYSSSKWYRDEVVLSKELSWFNLRKLENFKWFEDTEFYKKLFALSKDVEEIYINGGEPTLIEAHFTLLKKLIRSSQSRNIHLVYSLNLTNMPDEFLDLLKHFKKVTINCSIDDIDERNFYIRWPSKWSSILANIDKINKILTVDWHVTQTVSILNIGNLDMFRNWLLEKYNKEPGHNYVLYPNFLSVEAIPESYKKELVKKYKKTLNDHQYKDLCGKLSIKHDPLLTQQALEFITTLDQSRKLDYKKYVPDLDKVFLQ